jgi:hypothetical protein
MNRPTLLSCVGLFLLAAGALHCGAVASPPAPSARWPDAPAAAVTSRTDAATFAVDSLSFGEDSRDDWARYGFDLDRKITTTTSTDVCRRVRGAPAMTQRDGDFGIDNSFGQNVVPFLRTLAADPRTLSEVSTKSIRRGGFTLQLEITGLDGTSAQTNVGLATQVFASSVFDPGGAAPTFTRGEAWPVRNDLLAPNAGGSLASKYSFRNGYVTDGTFVSGVGELVLGAVFMGEPIDLHLRSAVIVGRVEGDGMTGTLAGAIDTAELVGAATRVAGRLNDTLCGSAFDVMALELFQASDLLLDGSNDPDRTCDAISMGVGFTARRVANPTRSTPPDVRPACVHE